MEDLRVLIAWEGTAIEGAVSDITGSGIISIAANLVVMHSDVFSWFTDDFHSLIAIPFVFLLVFRTNFAVQRYFEGRALVGKMVSLTCHCVAWVVHLAPEKFERGFTGLRTVQPCTYM